MSTYKGFSKVKLRKPERSKFDLSHEKRLSTRMGRLTPVFVTEVLPNDTVRNNTEVLLRLAPLLAPIMHRVNVFVHNFFIPCRLLWEDFEEFITHGRLGTETPPVPPNITWNQISGGSELLDTGTLWDYLGGQPLTEAFYAGIAGSIDMMPFAAYYKVWYDYYRDRNYSGDNDLLPMASGNVANPADARAMMEIRNRDWQKDYFTSALPWTQRGDEVLMPLQGSGSVTYLPTSLIMTTAGAAPAANTVAGTDASVTDLRVGKAAGVGVGVTGRIENIDSIDITTSDVSINDLRQALRLQEWLERQALGGSRMTETIWVQFNRRSSDGRLQRAEYLGGGRVTVKISEVVTTAYSEDADTNIVPPANMAGHGISYGSKNGFTYNCEEWGFIIGIMSVMPTSAYMQGIPRMFRQRNTFLDYPWPSFAHLGEQEVYKYELLVDGAAANIPGDRSLAPVFGYQSRYADWKYIASSSHGDFRNSLVFWHLTRLFSSNPTLGAAFCTFEDELQDRVFAVSDVDTLWCYIYNQCSVVRSLPYYGTPLI